MRIPRFYRTINSIAHYYNYYCNLYFKETRVRKVLNYNYRLKAFVDLVFLEN
jgi:hypothetical protein